MTLVEKLRELARDDSGAGTAEYAVIAAGIALAMVTVLGMLQSESGGQLSNTGTGMTNFAVSPP